MGELSPFWELCTPLATGGAQASWGLITASVFRGKLNWKTASLFTVPIALVDQTGCTADIHRPAYTELELLSDLQSGDEIVIVMGDETGCIEQCQETQSDCSRCNDCGLKPLTVPLSMCLLSQNGASTETVSKGHQRPLTFQHSHSSTESG